MQVTIREATREDYPALAEIKARTFNEGPWKAGVTAEKYVAGYRKGERRSTRMRLVAEQDGKIVGLLEGFLSRRIVLELPPHKRKDLPTRVFHLSNFMVNPEVPVRQRNQVSYPLWRQFLRKLEGHRGIQMRTLMAKTHPENLPALQIFLHKDPKRPPRFHHVYTGPKWPNRRGTNVAYFVRVV